MVLTRDCGLAVALSWKKFKAAFRYEIVWRTVIFLVEVAVLTVIGTRWNRWEGDAEWQSTDDAYLQADLTPISAKVTGYIRTLPVQDRKPVGCDSTCRPTVCTSRSNNPN
jgi:multidrug resistance efflux pump